MVGAGGFLERGVGKGRGWGGGVLANEHLRVMVDGDGRVCSSGSGPRDNPVGHV